MQEPAFVKQVFTSIAGRYDLANHLLSGGLDFLWRQRVGRIVRGWEPRTILDLATGSGDVALTLQKVCPLATIIGADFCQPMLLEATKKGVQHLVVADAMRLPFTDAAFEVLTVAFGLRNMASYPGALREMARVIRPGGHLLVLDFSLPPWPLRAPYRWYLHRMLPHLASLLTVDRSAYEYLGESIEKFPNGAEMTALIDSCGFHKASAEPLSAGIVSIYTATRG